MSNINLGTSSIDNSRTVLTVNILNATGAVTVVTPGITVTVGGNTVTASTPVASGSGSNAKLTITLSKVVPVGQAINITAASSGIHDSLSYTLANGVSIVGDTLSQNQTASQAIHQAAIQNWPFIAQLQNGLFGKVVSNGGNNYTIYQQDNKTPFATMIAFGDSAGNLTVQSVYPYGL